MFGFVVLMCVCTGEFECELSVGMSDWLTLCWRLLLEKDQ